MTDPPNRPVRPFMAATYVVAVISLLVVVQRRVATADETSAPNGLQRPNVLFIAVDDLNDWIGVLGGHPQAQTPHLDRLAASGVNFTNAHCQAPICNPSRVSLLTGTLPSSTGIYYLSPGLRQWKATARSVTLPQHFAEHGYATIGGGKIFHSEGPGEFQTFAGRFGGFGPRPAVNLNCDHVHPLWDWGAFPKRDQQMPDARLADWAAAQVAQPHDRPFFLACGFFRPHVPLYVPQKWFDKYPLSGVQLPDHRPDDLLDVPRYGQDLSWSAVAPRHLWMVENDQWRRAVQAYLASVSFVDAQVGKVLDALRSGPNAANTLIVLWSDHGFHLGTKERWGKRSLWEPSTRVVLMIAGPDLPAGATCDRPVGLVDLYPTLVELCQLTPRLGLEGHSLVPLLKDSQTDWPWPALTTFGQHNHAIRTQRWRFIQYADGTEELYDHQHDPHEYNNLASDRRYQEILVRHRRWLPQVNQPLATGSAHCDARPGSAADIDGKPTFARPSPLSHAAPR